MGRNGMSVVVIAGGDVSASEPEALTAYDAGGRFAYEWDAENRLIAVETATNKVGTAVPAVRLEFAYDYMSRRVGKTVSQWTGSEWSPVSSNTFLYDGWNLVCELSNPATGNPTTNYYVWGQDISGSLQGAGGIRGLLATVRSGDPEPVEGFPLFDANGNITDYVTSDGTLSAHYEYSPFGETIVSTGSAADDNPFRFSTKYWDNETGLGYWGYRYYHPDEGRWLSRDPIGEAGGGNLFAMCANNCVLYSDYLGQRTCCEQALDAVWNVAGSQIAGLYLRNCLERIECKRVCNNRATTAGCYGPDSDGKWRICIREGSRSDELQRTIFHELQHAETQCGSRPTDCGGCLRDEIRAMLAERTVNANGQIAGVGAFDTLSLQSNCRASCPFDSSRHYSWYFQYRQQISRLFAAARSETTWFQQPGYPP